MKIYSYPYRNKYGSVINLSYVVDTIETPMASSMKHPITGFLLDISMKKHTLTKIIMAGQRLSMNSCVEIIMARGGLGSSLHPKSFCL